MLKPEFDPTDDRHNTITMWVVGWYVRRNRWTSRDVWAKVEKQSDGTRLLEFRWGRTSYALSIRKSRREAKWRGSTRVSGK